MSVKTVDPRTGKPITVLFWNGELPSTCGLCDSAKPEVDLYLAGHRMMIFVCADCAKKLRRLHRLVIVFLAVGCAFLLWILFR